MFLPVLLVRDYGVWGWVVFAVPNVLGATAMAFVLSRPGSSEALVEKHRTACATFSFVSIAFQGFFLFWVVSFISIPWVVVAIAIACVTGVVSLFRSGGAMLSATLVWLISVGVLVWILQIAPPEPFNVEFPQTFSVEGGNLITLSVVCMFGFLLCPYLDLTFHYARQSQGSGSAKISFVIGFCVFFLVMLILTLAYARPMVNLAFGEPFFGPGGTLINPLFANLVAFHMTIQILFTMFIHVRKLFAVLSKKSAHKYMLTLNVTLFACLLLGAIFESLPELFGLDGREVVFRAFMVFYALVAPAYVFLFTFSPRRSIR
jgi:hypothetical protein